MTQGAIDAQDRGMGMPVPGAVYPGFVSEPNRCWRMVYSAQLQATHCAAAPAWTGRWFSPKGDRWWPVWACPDHRDGLSGLRPFGQIRSSGA